MWEGIIGHGLLQVAQLGEIGVRIRDKGIRGWFNTFQKTCQRGSETGRGTGEGVTAVPLSSPTQEL